jgi:hypothetical protein
MNLQKLLVLGVTLLGFSQGCVKPAPPTTEGITPFTVDPAVPPLQASCATDSLAGCETTKSLLQAIATMKALHAKQMAEIETALSSLQGVLSRPDSTPSTNIQTVKLDTDTWTDVDARYPADLIVRMEQQRGLSYMGEKSVDDLNGALHHLKQTSEAHKSEWDSTLRAQPKGIVLPKELLAERASSSVSATLHDNKYNFDVPTHLGKKYIKRDVSPWVALAAHVISEPGMQYEVIYQHVLPLPDALSVTGQGPFTIVEHSPEKTKITKTSQILPSDVCESLRGELRYVRKGSPIPVRAAFRVDPNAGGAK